ncbi:unnamed protein product [Anisakis simplex]|uniref:LIM and SH3 domain protein (inferred by orthology to a C. elegans protein) n=1 Tax=Anisakis simplex TaxID=6269 RepID=A0A0M3K0Q8_ANISI|nr:unnamed protein product [Anisakis simplex]
MCTFTIHICVRETVAMMMVWHKQCFKCTVCGMTLNMKNYKGYNRMPYCEPHYPKTVASVVVDTPEMRRLAENTRLQSQVKYHEQFEKSKGQKIEIADDPELARHLRNTRVQSQVAYHGELEKKKLQDEIRPAAEQVSGAVADAVDGQSELLLFPIPVQFFLTSSAITIATANSCGVEFVDSNKTESATSYGFVAESHTPVPASGNYTQPQNAPSRATATGSRPEGGVGSPYSRRLASQSGTVIYSSEQGGRVPIQQRPVGSIADYDPLNGNWGTVGSSRASEKIGTLHQSCRKFYRILLAAKSFRVDFSTFALFEGALSGAKQQQQQQQHKAAPAQAQPAAAAVVNGAQGVGVGVIKPGAGGAGFTVKALYDYTAADKDEVTFVEGDIIVNCQKVDEGWMTGTVKRTLQWGMLPANYVERIKQSATGLHYLS